MYDPDPHLGWVSLYFATWYYIHEETKIDSKRSTLLLSSLTLKGCVPLPSFIHASHNDVKN
jgi:hypothetical protein